MTSFKVGPHSKQIGTSPFVCSGQATSEFETLIFDTFRLFLFEHPLFYCPFSIWKRSILTNIFCQNGTAHSLFIHCICEYIYIHIISYARSIYICNGYIIMVCCWTYPPWMQGATSKNLHPSRRNQDSIEPKPGVLLDHVYAGKALHHFCVPWPFGPLPWGDSQKFQRLKWVV